jgi:protein-tyrosine phosphatase
LWQFLCVADRNTKSEVFRLSDPKPGVRELAAYVRPFARKIGASVSSRLRNLYLRIVRTLWAAGVAVGLHRMVLKSRFPKRVERVLVLCTGNICRSPFAACWLQARVSEQNGSLEIASAGLDTTPGKEAYPLAAVTSRKHGIDLDRHRTTLVSAELVGKADVILVMELAHIRQLLEKFPEVSRKTFLLGHFAQERPLTDIRDPYGGTPEEFTRCYSFLSAACEGFLFHLQQASLSVRLAEPARSSRVRL